MSGRVRPKKHLGQHFLDDDYVAEQIVKALEGLSFDVLIEVGPGEGVLTQRLAPKYEHFMAVEFDTESVDHLLANDVLTADKIFQGDFLQWQFPDFDNIAVIGNFPYNISSQIVFKLIDDRAKISGMVGMFQREVAQRITSPPGSKAYGIVSVLTQAWFECEYLFTVDETAFRPAPKVKSGVIRIKRKDGAELGCDPKRFKQVVKMAFNQRRKMMRNSLSALFTDDVKPAVEQWLTKRPEQLHYTEFVAIANAIDAVK